MKIAYLMLCHDSADIVLAIAHRLLDTTNDVMIVHVDKKTNISEFKQRLGRLPRVYILDDRVAVYWGGFSSVDATVRCMRRGLELNCNRFVVLQGKDWPVHSGRETHRFFELHRDTEYINAYNVTNSPRRKSYMKSWGAHLFDGVDRSKLTPKTIVAKGLSLFNKLGIRYRRGFYLNRRTQERKNIYWGWAHIALTDNCVRYVLDEYETNITLRKYFKKVFPADETYFQTLVYNSKFSERTLAGGELAEATHTSGKSMLNLTYFEYPGKVRIFDDPAELAQLDLSKFLFVRKVSAHFVEVMEQNM